ncbi:MAG: WYL domain-containing protein [Gemmatimonadales bacterium]|nr:WYL domain-containing protein [Gemmatimonadales bacterium]
MPRKLNPDISHSDKLIKLLGYLFFRPGSRSLTQLATELGCSKQGVQSLVAKVESGYGVRIGREKRGNRLFYIFASPRKFPPAAMLSSSELNTLQMCRAFTENLLGVEQFGDAMLTIEKSSRMLPEDEALPEGNFGVLRFGTIDYSPFQKQLRTLVEAMEKKRVCEVKYRRVLDKRSKTFRIKPLKIFAHKESVYVHARYAKMPGEPFKGADYDPLLALHRIKTVAITDTKFVLPKDYNFERTMNRQFGVIRGQRFKVKAEFTGWAAGFVTERTWSPDQKVTRRRGGGIALEFTASSEPEVLNWILNFGDEAKLIGPKALVGKLRERLATVSGLYT